MFNLKELFLIFSNCEVLKELFQVWGWGALCHKNVG